MVRERNDEIKVERKKIEWLGRVDDYDVYIILKVKKVRISKVKKRK